MRPDEGKKFQALSPAGRAAFAADVNKETVNDPNGNGNHPETHAKLMGGFYDKL